MNYHLFLSGPKSGGVIAAKELLASLRAANGENSARIAMFGKYKNLLLRDRSYNLEVFKSELIEDNNKNPNLTDVIISGPGVFKEFFGLRDYLVNPKIYLVKLENRTTEKQAAADFLISMATYKRLGIVNSANQTFFSQRYTEFLESFYETLDDLQADLGVQWQSFSGFSVSGTSISANANESLANYLGSNILVARSN